MPFDSLDSWTDPDATLPSAEGEIHQAAPSEGYGFVEGFSESWTMSRELDSTVGAINRVSEENDFPVDPTYNLDNLDELMEEIPANQQEMFQKRLLDAKSADHASFIKDRFQYETQVEEQLAQFGGTGLTARIGVNIFDETAITLGLASGPAAAAVKYGRLKRAMAFAGIAGLENSAAEAIIRAGSQTRTYEDVIVAGLMGMVLGGSLGAVTKPGMRAAGDPKLAERADKGLDQMDDAMVRELKGTAAPKHTPRMKEMNDDQEYSLAFEIAVDADRRAPLTPTAHPEAPARVADAAAEIESPTSARLAEIDVRVKELADTDIEVVKPAKSVDMLPGIKAQVEELQAAKAAHVPGDAKSKAKLTNLEMKVNKLKREFLGQLRDDAPDAYADSGLTTNLKMDDFARGLTTGIPKMVNRIQKASTKAIEENDAAFKAVDDEVATLAEETKSIKAEQEADLSAGAAEVEGTVAKPLDTMTDEEAEFFADTPDTAFARVRMGIYSMLNRSENLVMKRMGNILTRDSVGNADHSASVRSAEEIAAMHTDVVMAKYARVDNAAYADWLIETNNRFKGAMSAEVKHDFNVLVTQAVETGNSESAAVLKAAKATSEAIQDTMELAADAGVRGFDEFQHSDLYMPHIHNEAAWTKAQRIYRNTEKGGRPPMVELAYRSMKSAMDIEGDDEVILKLAQGYVRNVTSRAAGINGQYSDVARTTDPEYLRSLLTDMEMDDDTIDYVTGMLRVSEDAKGKGKSSRAKKRTMIDMETQLRVKNEETGEMEFLTMRSLFEQDSQKLMTSYVRSIGGLAAVAKRTKGTAFHIRGQEDFDRAMRLASNYEAGIERTQGFSASLGTTFNRATAGGANALSAEAEAVKMAWNMIVGRPVNDPGSAFTTFTRRVSDFNFARVMGQVAWAQFAEFGPVVSKMGLSGMARAMPEFKAMMTRGADGKLESELAAVAEEWLGTGAEFAKGKFNYVMFKDPESYGAGFNKWDTTMHHVNRVVAAPLVAMMTGQQRMLAIGMLHNFGKRAKTGKVLSEAKMRTLAGENITQAKLDRINAAFNEHGTYKGNKLLNPNFDAWDSATRDDILGSLFMMGKRAVQQNEIGNINPLLNKNLGKLSFQFRTFVIGAWEKHLLHGVHNYKDLENFQGFALSTMFSAIAYYGQTYGQAVGMSDDKRKKFLKHRLSEGSVAAKIFGRTTHASLIPTIMDTMGSLGGLDPMFSRASGQSTNFVTGNPSVDLLFNKLPSVITGGISAATQSDYSYSQQDVNNARYSLPMANLLGMSNLWEVLSSPLPTKSTGR